MNYGPNDKAVVRFARKTEKEGDESMRVPFDISQTQPCVCFLYVSRNKKIQSEILLFKKWSARLSDKCQSLGK